MDPATLTQEIKKYALTHGAELVGVLSPESIDDMPKYWTEWQVKQWSKKTSDYMDSPMSILVLGYHAFDDIHEAQIAHNGKIEYPVYERMRLYARRVMRQLEEKGYECVVYPFNLSQKKMAQLAGLGTMGKSSLIINPEYGPWFRLQSILTDAPLVPDEEATDDSCGDCTKCIDACPTGALTPYVIDPEKCLIGITEIELAKLIEEDLQFTVYRDTPDEVFREHMPRFTKNSVLMCTTCQKACPVGREKHE
ncbi:epoxyqueuosine reductase [Candidatus Bathyarchaeota archaeon]|nr:epoxyqueuosine reductase [Candidatus Bathyarchaeota archaeon]MBT5641901.1 epoxyqueuosine reductase [Candidatus Bathyarchaeota archaeon]MBT6604875.1 epoxyqueuosine reductase [Candidatus Bathyarchaeota archaeon]